MNPFKNSGPALSSSITGTGNKTATGTGNAIIDSINLILPEEIKLLPSNLAAVVNVLGKRLACEEEYEDINAFKIEDKISHNNVQAYRGIINEYSVYSGKLSIIYSEGDKEGVLLSFNTLSNIKHHYLKAKGEMLLRHLGRTDIEIVREKADEIFKMVEEKLFAEIVNSSNINASRDTINVSLQVVMVDAFIRCKILEHPSKF